MDATSFFVLIIDFVRRLFDMLNSVSFSVFNYRVTLSSVIFAFMIISVVITIFYKGGRTS